MMSADVGDVPRHIPRLMAGATRRLATGRTPHAVLGVLLLGVATLPACATDPPYLRESCEPTNRGGRSVARIWNEQILSLVRQVVPAPTVHARNLFHLSGAMWDAWAAYDGQADGWTYVAKHDADNTTVAREVAISYAAHRILEWRYATVADLETASDELDATMAALCLDPEYASTDGDDPAAVGNRIAEAVIERGAADGSLEEARHVDSSYVPANEPLVVAESGTTMADPDRWQPLALERQLSQNGLPIPGQVQSFIGPHWGSVTGFAIPPSEEGTPIDPGPPPRLGDPATDAAYREAAMEVLRYSSWLDPADGVTLDIGPGSLGDNRLGANDGDGHDANPATQSPYEPNLVHRADYARALAEYWADGPKSETPPGHWNVIANAVSDAEGFAHRIGGEAEPVDRLEWDVKLYFALNGAVHDAAVAAWGLKGHYDSPRPISMIRFLGSNGQSSDPGQPGHDPGGLPLEAGLVEVVTEDSSAPGERHAHLAGHLGEVAVRAWRGFPEDPEHDRSGVGWILAADWVPYQRSTFVSPAFAGYVSGHSTFSRAAAEVMAAFTGDAYFPGGVYEHQVEAGAFIHEEGPAEPITIQWATYADAADAAGISRLFMGIHIAADDTAGRRIGWECGRAAWDLATKHFAGSAEG